MNYPHSAWGHVFWWLSVIGFVRIGMWIERYRLYRLKKKVQDELR